MDQAIVAGIIYNETSGLRPIAGYEEELKRARVYIANIAMLTQGRRLARPKIPDDAEMKDPLVRQIWNDCLTAAAEVSQGVFGGDCVHFVIWPSTDGGMTPTDSPKMDASWPYTQLSKIRNTFGPLTNPKKVGDVPKGNNIYIFVYCGVK